MTSPQPTVTASSLYLPESFIAAQKAMEAGYIEKAGSLGGYGPEMGSGMVLGPAGELARILREHNSNRQADKALYYYLYRRHPFVYSCVEIIVQTSAQDRHTYPSEDLPHGQGSVYGKSNVKKVKSDGGRRTKKATPAARTIANYIRAIKTGKYEYQEDDASEDDLGPYPEDGVEFLENYFAEVNDFESFSDLLESIYRDLLISGEAFILKQRLGGRVASGLLPLGPAEQDGNEAGSDGTGRYSHVRQNPKAPVVSLHRIPSRFTEARPGADGYPSKFRQYSDGGGFREYAIEDVIFFKLPDPDDPSRGLSPLEALDLSLATDLSAAKYNEAYFRNGAKAGMVFSMQGVSEHDIRRNREWINNEYVRPENSHKPMTLLGNVQLVRDGNKAQQDMDFIELRAFTREDICAVYSVPLSKLLMEEGGMGHAGKMSDDITFRADTVGPLQTKVYETINRQLMKKEFPGLPLLIPPRQEKIRLDLLEAAKSLVACGGTGNEARAILHLPEIEHDTMNLPLFLVPGIKSLITDDTANQAASDGEPLSGGNASDAKRADRTSQRTANGRTNAKVKGGRGMKTRKAEVDLLGAG